MTYKAGALKNLLGVPMETIRYWRKHLDPQCTRTVFTPEDAFVYRIMMEMIYKRKQPVLFLKHADWGPIFDTCNETPYSILRKHFVVFNADEQALKILPLSDPPDPYDTNLTVVHLGNVYEAHVEALLESGKPKDNVISIDQTRQSLQASKN